MLSKFATRVLVTHQSTPYVCFDNGKLPEKQIAFQLDCYSSGDCVQHIGCCKTRIHIIHHSKDSRHYVTGSLGVATGKYLSHSMSTKHNIILLVILLPLLSAFGLSRQSSSRTSTMSIIDSTINATGYATFNFYTKYYGLSRPTTAGLLVLNKDGSFVCKRILTGDTSYCYENRWHIDGDTLILFEDTHKDFVDKDNKLLVDSNLCIDMSPNDTDEYFGMSFGKIFLREYEKGHDLQWRNQVKFIAGKDSIGIFIKPVNYSHSKLPEHLGRQISMPYAYIDSFIPYEYVRPWNLMNSPMQIVRFPHLLKHYDPSNDSIYHVDEKVLKYYRPFGYDSKI